MNEAALIEVLGAISYGEWKAHEGAKAKSAAAVTEEDRRAWKKVAAEELRHYRGFVARLQRLGADPERAMAPYRRALDRYHSHRSGDPVAEAVDSYLGEGIADDLLRWFRLVVDDETARFIDSVLADEVEHEGRAAAELRAVLEADPASRRRAARAARLMLLRMTGSGTGSYASFMAFLRLGRPLDLLGSLVSGYARRMATIGVGPLAHLPLPG